MADMVGGEIQEQPDMRISEPVVDPATISPGPHHIGSTEQPHRLTHHVLRHTGNTGQVAHAQLTGLQQRMQNRQPSRITQQPEQFCCLDVRLATRHAIPQRIQRCRRLVAMRRTDIEINNGSLATGSHN